jgi:NADP-dependent aldehyde dehydrogenase
VTEYRQIIGFDDFSSGQEYFNSYSPADDSYTTDKFFKATAEDVNASAEKAATAFQVYRQKSGKEKALFLESIAAQILSVQSELVPICVRESGLFTARIEGELGRTVSQLKMFAALLREGSWPDARIDTAIPGRTPVPKPDLRFLNRAIGPVVVFGASNFPLAFSVAGGDTASALAAGCPVIVKAHSSHPATSVIVGNAIRTAAQNSKMPEGVFSLLFDDGFETGLRLVRHPLIKAVAFTGSFNGGKAIFDAAVSRPEPIPVYAEMGSTNPVFVLPLAMKERGDMIAEGFSSSVTLGAGQFCTNPGLIIFSNSDFDFKLELKNKFESTSGGVMLTRSINNAYMRGVQENLNLKGVEHLATGQKVAAGQHNYGTPTLLSTTGKAFIENHRLSEEVFGPASIAVNVNSKEEMFDIASGLSGHLTASIHGTEDELIEYKNLIDILEQKVGRIVINSFPTGVEVCSSMVHGGPYPATTDSRTTSVGTASIFRFVRPVCFQNMPQALLPDELKNENLLQINRLINGEISNKDVIY